MRAFAIARQRIPLARLPVAHALRAIARQREPRANANAHPELTSAHAQRVCMLPSTYMDCYMVEPRIVQRGVDGYTQLYFEAQGFADPMRGTPNDAEAGEDATRFINLSKMGN